MSICSSRRWYVLFYYRDRSGQTTHRTRRQGFFSIVGMSRSMVARAVRLFRLRHTIAINGSFFNTHRMVAQYMNDAYFVVDSYFRKVIQHE